MTQERKNPSQRSNAPRESQAYTPEKTIMTWSSSMLQRRPKTFAVGVLATLLGLVLVWWSFGGSLGPVILAAFLMGGALGPLYFPTRFILTDKKAYQKIFFSQDGHRWKDFDEYHVMDDGVFLHLRPTDLRLRYLKGLTLYFGSNNREEVLGVVKQFVQVDGSAKSQVGSGSADKK